MEEFDGYQEAFKVDKKIEELYKTTKPLSVASNRDDNMEKRQALNKAHKQDMEKWRMEISKYLRTIEITCTLLQDKIRYEIWSENDSIGLGDNRTRSTV